MIREQTTEGFYSGVQTKIPSEQIASTAASDALNWISINGVLELARGRQRIGADGIVGGIFGEIFAARKDGNLVHFRKTNTKIQYFDGAAWQDIITGLIAGAAYTFAPYISLAGSYVYATGPDGLFKIAVANPGSFKNMHGTGNHLGYSLINDQRMFLWHRTDGVPDYTALYLSKIDPQDGNYHTVANETIGTGDGSTTMFTHTLAQAIGLNFAFGVTVYVPLGTTYTITGITQASNAVVTVASTVGISAGDFLIISGVVGMTEINGLMGTVVSTTPTTITLSINSSTFTGYSSGGKATEATQYLDDYNGNIGVIGTVNYATGGVSITTPSTLASGLPIVANYQYENSNIGGITDFGQSVPRVAGEGDFLPQEFLGEAIQNVIYFEGSYYSFKKTCVYQLTIAEDDTTATNTVFRVGMGIPARLASTATSKGIAYMDTSNLAIPILTLLQKNPVGGNLEPVNLTPLFKWEDYQFDQCVMDTWGEFILVSAHTPDSLVNNRTFLVNTAQKYSVDITGYGANTFAKDGSANLFCGDPFSDTVYQIFSGFDDLGDIVENQWTGRSENFGYTSKTHSVRYINPASYLKRVRKLCLKGLIDPAQAYEIYGSYDGDDFTLMGTVRGDQGYVDYANPQTIGSNGVGTEVIGGGANALAYPYQTEIPLRAPKFRVRMLKFVALGIGYVSIEWWNDFDILLFEQRMPKRFRQQAWPNLAGTSFDNPQFGS